MPLRPEEGAGSPGTGVIGSWEPSHVGAGLWSSRRTVSTPSHLSVPVFCFFVVAVVHLFFLSQDGAQVSLLPVLVAEFGVSNTPDSTIKQLPSTPAQESI